MSPARGKTTCIWPPPRWAQKSRDSVQSTCFQLVLNMSNSLPASTTNRTVGVAEQLSRAGFFPPRAAESHNSLQIETGTNLLAVAIALWESSGEALKDRGRADETLHWLKDQRELGAALTVGMPRPSGEAAEKWLAARLVWWPDGICTARRVGVASSRLGRRLDEQQTWFAVLRGACAKLDGDRETFLTAGGTASARFVDHAAELFGARVLSIELPRSDDITLRQWLRRIRTVNRSAKVDCQKRAILSPPILDLALSEITATEIRDVPLRDRALIGLSDRILAIHVRRGGNLHRLLQQRLHDTSWPVASVYVALGTDLTATATAGELMDAGAVGWVISTRQLVRHESGRQSPPITRSLLDGPRLHRRPAPIVEPPSSDHWTYLTHCTRRRDGTWPDQSDEEFLDDLILERRESAHSALASLARIVNERRLRASSEGIRGRAPVVSFTAAPLDEIARMRVFRSHRGRWDFEPYGICISQDWLAQRSVRPVQYGNDQLWRSLAAADRPFFQIGQSVTSEQVMVWTAEQEWRHVGDVTLRRLPPDAAFIFVPKRDEAERIAEISPWPVAVV